MADNTHYYGFRWARSNGKPCPSPEWKTVATTQDDQDDSANSVDLNIGDPVKLLAAGGVGLAVAGDNVYGIIVAVAPYWDGSVMKPSNKLPNQTNWGTAEARRSMVGVVPASAGYWEIDVDDATTATTYAAYIALLGSNCDHAVPGNTSETSADPKLDISTTATTQDNTWRLVDISSTMANKDFSGANVKVIVAINDSQEAGWPATQTVGL